MPGFVRKNLCVCVGLFLGVILAGCTTQQLPPDSECPQPRFTGKAPDDYYVRKNPLQSSEQDIAAAERLYRGGPKLSCATCHGDSGNGKGPMSGQFDPPPRNFACAETVNGIPDGQLFWIIRYGSPGTAMPPHPGFSDAQIWQLVLYLRRLAR